MLVIDSGERAFGQSRPGASPKRRTGMDQSKTVVLISVESLKALKFREIPFIILTEIHRPKDGRISKDVLVDPQQMSGGQKRCVFANIIVYLDRELFHREQERHDRG